RGPLSSPSASLTTVLQARSISPALPLWREWREERALERRGGAGEGWTGAKPSSAQSGKGAAFVSKQEGSEVVKRLRRYLDQGLGAPAPYPDPLEPMREVCEFNPDCDELADHIGIQDAYKRFYGTGA
ncbi:Osteocalcin, partial [Galemys pyrenaicus]